LQNTWYRVNVTTHALKCIDRVGDFDEFILFAKPSILEDSEFAQNLRHQLIPLWEQKYNTTYDRRKILLERRLADLAVKRESLINQINNKE
jgi:hypothetical protein